MGFIMDSIKSKGFDTKVVVVTNLESSWCFIKEDRIVIITRDYIDWFVADIVSVISFGCIVVLD